MILQEIPLPIKQLSKHGNIWKDDDNDHNNEEEESGMVMIIVHLILLSVRKWRSLGASEKNNTIKAGGSTARAQNV